MTNATLTPRVDVRRAEERFKTRLGWLDSKHSFSFSSHYDPAQHPPRAAAGQQRRHRRARAPASRPTRTSDMEIVTWVLQGSLVHQDSDRPHRASSTRAWRSG